MQLHEYDSGDTMDKYYFGNSIIFLLLNNFDWYFADDNTSSFTFFFSCARIVGTIERGESERAREQWDGDAHTYARNWRSRIHVFLTHTHTNAHVLAHSHAHEFEWVTKNTVPYIRRRLPIHTHTGTLTASQLLKTYIRHQRGSRMKIRERESVVGVLINEKSNAIRIKCVDWIADAIEQPIEPIQITTKSPESLNKICIFFFWQTYRVLLRRNSIVWHSVNQLSLTDRMNVRRRVKIAERSCSSFSLNFNGRCACVRARATARTSPLFVYRTAQYTARRPKFIVSVRAWVSEWVLLILMHGLSLTHKRNTLLLLLAHWSMVALSNL